MRNRNGFTLMEILLAIIVMTVSAAVFLIWQKSSWSQTGHTTRLMNAGHIIEKQVEAMRMWIAENPTQNFARFKNMTDTTITDSSVTPPVSVQWVISNAYAPDSTAILNVMRVEMVAAWGDGADDTLRVETTMARDF